MWFFRCNNKEVNRQKSVIGTQQERWPTGSSDQAWENVTWKWRVMIGQKEENQREKYNHHSGQKRNNIQITTHALYPTATEILGHGHAASWRQKDALGFQQSKYNFAGVPSVHLNTSKAVQKLWNTGDAFKQHDGRAGEQRGFGRLQPGGARWPHTGARRLSVTMDHWRPPAVFTVTVNTAGGHSPLANMTRGAVALFKATRVTECREEAVAAKRSGNTAASLSSSTCHLAQP